MAPLAIDEPDKAGNGPAWKHLGEKHEKAVEEPRHDHVFAAHGFHVGNMRGCLGCHAGVLPLLADTGAGTEFGLGDARTEHGDTDARSLQFVLQR